MIAHGCRWQLQWRRLVNNNAVNATVGQKPLCPFWHCRIVFSVWILMLSSDGHLASPEYTSWPRHLRQLVAFGGVRWHLLFRYRPTRSKWCFSSLFVHQCPPSVNVKSLQIPRRLACIHLNSNRLYRDCSFLSLFVAFYVQSIFNIRSI